MKKHSALMFVLVLCASISFGLDTHEKKVEQVKDTLKNRQQKLIDESNLLAVELVEYKIQSPSFTMATNKLSLMNNDRAWRDLSSRETRTCEQAKSKLNDAMDWVKVQLGEARKPVEMIKKAEYEAWARAHPEAAKIKELERRVASAESSAYNAEQESQTARNEAAKAQMDANNAAMAAQEAQNDANRAQRKAANAEGALQSHGIHSW